MMSYLQTKFHDKWISIFRGVAMTRFWDGRTDGQTDGRSDPTPRPALAFGDACNKLNFLSVDVKYICKILVLLLNL